MCIFICLFHIDIANCDNAIVCCDNTLAILQITCQKISLFRLSHSFLYEFSTQCRAGFPTEWGGCVLCRQAAV